MTPWCQCRGANTCIGCMIEEDVRARFGGEGVLYLREHLVPSEKSDIAALKYLHDSTAPDGQWADQAVHTFVGAMLKSNAAPQAPVDTNSGCRDQGRAPEVAPAVAAPLVSYSSTHGEGHTLGLDGHEERITFSSDKEVLLPCPFCGVEPLRLTKVTFECNNGDCLIGGMKLRNADAWNRRAALSARGEHERALADALKLVLDDWANANAVGDDARARAEKALDDFRQYVGEKQKP